MIKCSQCHTEMTFYRKDGSKKYGYEYHYSCPKCYFKAKRSEGKVCDRCGGRKNEDVVPELIVGIVKPCPKCTGMATS